ncbi:MAG: FkbM family methyltransferase, partial [Methylacidiphilales bacterium]|nr:FkbM family methyltransferase [Candidatus Methylacidiphilales bacterium]
MSISCVVIDAGARYGLHPSWADMRNLAEFHLFEMDEVEAERLARKYAKDSNIAVYPIALYKENATLRFKVSAHQALNSLFSTNDDVLQRNEYMIRDFAVQDERTAQARSIDSLFEGKDVHFLKLDIEGAELAILQAMRNACLFD